MRGLGRRILAGASLWTIVAGYPTDWNRTHLFNLA